MRSKSNNTLPVWSDMRWTAWPHAHTLTKAEHLLRLFSLHIRSKQPSGKLVDPGHDWVTLWSSLAEALWFCSPQSHLSSALSSHSSLLPATKRSTSALIMPSSKKKQKTGWWELNVHSPLLAYLTSPEGECGCANHTIASLLHRIISSPAARRLGILAIFLSDVRHTLREDGLYTFYWSPC